MLPAYRKQIIKNQGKTVRRCSYYPRVLTEELLRTFSFGHHSRQSNE